MPKRLDRTCFLCSSFLCVWTAVSMGPLWEIALSLDDWVLLCSSRGMLNFTSGQSKYTHFLLAVWIPKYQPSWLLQRIMALWASCTQPTLLSKSCFESALPGSCVSLASTGLFWRWSTRFTSGLTPARTWALTSGHDLNAMPAVSVLALPCRLQLVVQKRPPAAPSVPECPRLQHLIQQCLQLDPSQRPSAQAAAQVQMPPCLDPWLSLLCISK